MEKYGASLLLFSLRSTDNDFGGRRLVGGMVKREGRVLFSVESVSVFLVKHRGGGAGVPPLSNYERFPGA